MEGALRHNPTLVLASTDSSWAGDEEGNGGKKHWGSDDNQEKVVACWFEEDGVQLGISMVPPW